MKKWLGSYGQIYDQQMKSYSSLLEAINSLRKEGYVEDFNLQQAFIEHKNGNLKIFHNEFIIDKYFRFDENSDPDNQSIIYAISLEKYQVKGTLVNAYGLHSESLTNEMLDKLGEKG